MALATGAKYETPREAQVGTGLSGFRRGLRVGNGEMGPYWGTHAHGTNKRGQMGRREAKGQSTTVMSQPEGGRGSSQIMRRRRQ